MRRTNKKDAAKRRLTRREIIEMADRTPAFTLSDQELAGLRKYLKNGGFLYADDCLFGFPFGPAFHGEMRRVVHFP